MQINYFLITLSFVVPIVKILFEIKDAKKVAVKPILISWLASGLLGSLVQFVAHNSAFVERNVYLIIIIVGFAAEKIVQFVDKNINKVLRTLVETLIENIKGVFKPKSDKNKDE